ncbi:helix-turn-helix transcriptional regulator [Streptomyces sp. NPDC050355]|uniref:helix-turn-helix transcriptional regulator n=1 Tax=Streptomyces sp. NPDC050355 TaxID=3365609 RepID=UPI003794BCB3
MPARWKPVDPKLGKQGRFAEKLREVLTIRGLQPAEVAKDASVSRATVYAVLAGHRIPSVSLVESMAGPRYYRSAGRPLPSRLRLPVLLKERDELEKEQRRRSFPPAPPVEVGILAEQKAFAEALAAWVKRYRPYFPHYWPEPLAGYGPGERGMSLGWLERFLAAQAIPSELGLYRLLPERPDATAEPVFRQCAADLDRLQILAAEARRARRAAREVARILRGGR